VPRIRSSICRLSVYTRSAALILMRNNNTTARSSTRQPYTGYAGHRGLLVSKVGSLSLFSQRVFIKRFYRGPALRIIFNSSSFFFLFYLGPSCYARSLLSSMGAGSLYGIVRHNTPP
jgi:hypothetical protein